MFILFIIGVLHAILGGITVLSNEDALTNPTLSRKKREAALIILIIFAPIFCLNNILEWILDALLPEDWNDNDDRRFGS